MVNDPNAKPAEVLPEFASLPRWSFGDTGALADELGALVLAGKKTATCSLFDGYAERGEALPRVGQRDIVLDGNKRPLCVIEIIEVEIRPAEMSARSLTSLLSSTS